MPCYCYGRHPATSLHKTLTASAAHVRLLGRHSKLRGLFSDAVWSGAALYLNADVHYMETLLAKSLGRCFITRYKEPMKRYHHQRGVTMFPPNDFVPFDRLYC